MLFILIIYFILNDIYLLNLAIILQFFVNKPLLLIINITLLNLKLFTRLFYNNNHNLSEEIFDLFIKINKILILF